MAEEFTPERPEQLVQLEETQYNSSTNSATAYGDNSIRLSRDEQKTLKQRMDVAEKYAENEFFENSKRCYKLLRGEHYQDLPTNEDRVVVNVMPHVVETLTHSVAFSKGDVIVKPLDRQGQLNADTAEKVADYELSKWGAFEQAVRAFKDSRIFNFGVLHSYWCFKTDADDYYGARPPVEGEPPDPQAVLDAIESGNPPPAPVPRAKVREDHYAVCRIDPRNFRVSPESSWVLEEMEYCGYVEYCRLEDVKRNRNFKNTRQLKGSTQNLEGYWRKEEGQPSGNVQFPTDLRRVKLIHYYEKRRRLHVVFCDEHDQALLVEKWPWQYDRYPFRIVFTEPGEDQFYQVPPLLQLRHMQQEVNHFHTQLSIHIRRFVRRYVGPDGALDANGKKALRSGVDGTYLPVQKGHPPNSIIPLMDAQISPDVYAYEQKVMQYLSLLSGIDQYEMQRPPTKRMTQAEVQQVASSGGARARRAAAAFEELMAGVAEDCIAWNQQYAIRVQELPLFDETGAVVDWRDWSADRIAGNYAFSISVGSTEMKNKAGMVEELAFLLQSLAPFFAPDPATGQPPLQVKPLLRAILGNVDAIDDVGAIVGPDTPPQPMLPPGPGGMPEGPGGPPPMSPLDQLAAQGPAPAGPLGIPGGFS